MSKSRVYTQDDNSKVSFEFDTDQTLVGITKDGSAVNPKTSEFETLRDSDDALDAYNVNKYKGNGSESTIKVAANDILQSHYNEILKKQNNEQFVTNDFEKPQAIAYSSASSSMIEDYERGAYRSKLMTGNLFDRDTYRKHKTDIFAYPIDINPNQDHMKIVKYRYVRQDVNQSKPPTEGIRNIGSFYNPLNAIFNRKVNVAGDSVKGSIQRGTVLLPMPKATDVNGVEWGKSELTTSGLAALGLAEKLSLGGRLTGETQFDRFLERRARRKAGRPSDAQPLKRLAEFSQAQAAQGIAEKAARTFGTELDADTFLARTGGRVLNPNAEMLFQGPVIRDFAFKFVMIARSEKEGAEIRKIIRFFKLGMAPKFRNTVFLKSPDIFTLEYKNGGTDADVLNTVNRFNPGGLALTTMNVDYAPDGYWAAYRDSQPVALSIDLNFTELRPIYEADQENTPEDSVGY